MLVIHQSICVRAIERMLFYYHRISIFVFFHVILCSLLLLCLSTALRMGVQTLYNTILITE